MVNKMKRIFKNFIIAFLSLPAMLAAMAAFAYADAINFYDFKSPYQATPTVKLNWALSGNSGRDYRVLYYKAGFPGTISTKTAGIDVTETTITENLEPNETFYFKIQAYKENIANYEDITDYISTTTLAMEIHKKGYNEITNTFFWEDEGLPPASEYRLIYSISQAFFLSNNVDTTGKSYSGAALTPNTVYYYKVGAKNSTGVYNFEKDENGDDIIMSTMTVPTPPTGLQINNSKVYESSVSLRWTNAANSAHRGNLRVEASLDGFASISAFTGIMTSTSIIASISDLEPNKQYQFRIAAINQLGGTSYSNIISTYTLAPKIDNNPSAISMSSDWESITVNFTPLNPADCISYRLDVSTHSDFSHIHSTSALNTASSAKVSGLEVATMYYVRMVTFNSQDAANITNLGTYETKTAGKPESIRFHEVFQTSATIKFTGTETPPTSYKIKLYKEDTFTTAVNTINIPSPSSGEQTKNATGLTPNTKYWISATAFFGDKEETGYSDGYGLTLPATVNSQSIADIYSSSFSVNHTYFSISDAEKYRIEFSTNQSFEPLAFEEGAPNDTNLTIIDNENHSIVPNTRYYVRGAMINEEGKGIFKAIPEIVTKAELPEYQSNELTSNSITIAFNALRNPDGTTFNVICSTDIESEEISYSIKSSSGHITAVCEGLSPITTYHVKVQAQNQINEKTPWKIIDNNTFTTNAATPNPATIISSSKDSVTVNLPGTFGNPEHYYDTEYKYILFYNSKDEFPSSCNTSKLCGETNQISSGTHTIENLQSNTKYYFWIKAVKGETSSAPSPESDNHNTISTWTLTAVPKPFVKYEEVYTAIGGNIFTANWQHGNNSEESEYEILILSKDNSETADWINNLSKYTSRYPNGGDCSNFDSFSARKHKVTATSYTAITEDNLIAKEEYYVIVRTTNTKTGNASNCVLVSTNTVKLSSFTIDNVYRDSTTVLPIKTTFGLTSLYIPAYSLSANMRLKLTPIDYTSADEFDLPFKDTVADIKLSSTGIGVRITTASVNNSNDSGVFRYSIDAPLTLTVAYSTAAIQNTIGLQDYEIGKLGLAFYDDTTNKWRPIDSSSETEIINGQTYYKIVSKIWNLGNYQITKPALSLNKNIEKVRIYPNPYKPNTAHGFVNFVNLPDFGNGSKIKIFTFLGELVREIDAPGTSASWDGRNAHGNEAASGIYIVFIQSKDDKSVKKTYKLAIER